MILGESGLRPSKAMTVCAAAVLAMVFSVQQGEHGPLVVYKLQLPSASDSAASAAAEPAEPVTVIIEDPEDAPAVPFGGMPLLEPAPVPLAIPAAEVEFDEDGALVNTETGGAVTLEQVNNALTWRRETAEKLRQVPIAPRF